MRNAIVAVATACCVSMMTVACGTPDSASGAAPGTASTMPADTSQDAREAPPDPAHDQMQMGAAGSEAGAAQTPAVAGRPLAPDEPVPTIALREQGHDAGAWRFAVDTDMTLTMAAGPYEPMKGHVHVYVDGVEKLMIAEKAFTLRNLTPGAHEIQVSLAGLDHQTILHNGAPIADSVEIVVPPPAE